MSAKFLTAGSLVLALGLSAGFSAPGLAQNNPPPRAGFPLTVNGTGRSFGHPAVADLKWPAPYDQFKSIVFTSWDGATARLHVIRYNGSSASQAPGFPVVLPPPQILGSVAVADLDGDGIPEILVPYGPQTASAGPGGVRALRRNSSQLWDHPSSNDFPSYPGNNFPLGVVSTPAVGDLDGDGIVEVAWGSFDGKVYVVDGRDGANKPGWPIFVRDTVWSSPVLADLDGDGFKEVVIGVDSHLEEVYQTIDGGALHVFRYNGTGMGAPASIPVPEFPGYPVNVDQTVFSAPAVGDIDGDGRPEIVFGTGTYWGNPQPCGSGLGSLRARRVYAVRCDGTIPAGWPVVTDGEVATAPALADLDGDDVFEVVVTDLDCSTGTARNFNVYAFQGNGLRRFKTLVRSFSGSNLSAADPVVADVLGDGTPEVLVPTNTEIAVFSSVGVQLTHSTNFSPPPQTTGLPSFYTPTSLGNATVASMKVSPTGSDPVDVIAVSASPFPSATNTQVYVWNPSGKTYATPPWGMFRQNPARTGLVPGTPSCVVSAAAPSRFFTLPPCRAIDTRNPGGLFGGPALGPGGTRSFDLAGRCAVPADAKAVSTNVTAIGPTAAGFLVLYPGGTFLPGSSNVNFSAGQTRANNTVVRLSADGRATLVVTNGGMGTTNFAVDVNGFFR